MFIAGYDVKPYVGALLAIIFIFAGIFSTANLIQTLGHWVAAKNATERGQWAWRWLRPAVALLLCAIAIYIVFLYVL